MYPSRGHQIAGTINRRNVSFVQESGAAGERPLFPSAQRRAISMDKRERSPGTEVVADSPARRPTSPCNTVVSRARRRRRNGLTTPASE
jgi:hypothetical protein